MIIGGSVVGSSVAYHLAMAGVKDIAVVERDPCYKMASAVLSAGGIRQQFSLPENVELSMYGIGIIKNPGILTVDDHEPCFQVGTCAIELFNSTYTLLHSSLWISFAKMAICSLPVRKEKTF